MNRHTPHRELRVLSLRRDYFPSTAQTFACRHGDLGSHFVPLPSDHPTGSNFHESMRADAELTVCRNSNNRNVSAAERGNVAVARL